MTAVDRRRMSEADYSVQYRRLRLTGSFLCWLGQVAATGTLLAFMLRGFIR